MICEIVKLWVILVPYPNHNFVHNSLMLWVVVDGRVGKVVVLGVAPEFFSNYFRSLSPSWGGGGLFLKTSISLSKVNLELLSKLYGRLIWDKTKLRFSILRLWLFPLKRKYFQSALMYPWKYFKFFFFKYLACMEKKFLA